MKKLLLILTVIGLIVLSTVSLGEKGFCLAVVFLSLILVNFSNLGNELGFGKPWAMFLLGLFSAGVLLPYLNM